MSYEGAYNVDEAMVTVDSETVADVTVTNTIGTVFGIKQLSVRKAVEGAGYAGDEEFSFRLAKYTALDDASWPRADALPAETVAKAKAGETAS